MNLHTLWFGYFVPSFWGNGPEAIAQTVLYGAIALLFVPPFRRWMQRHVDSIKEHLSGGDKELHEKLDHIIFHHPDIPPFQSDVVVKKNPPAKKVARDAHGRFTK